MKVGLAFDHKDAFVPRPGDPPDAASEWDGEETIADLEASIRACGHEAVRLGGGRDLLLAAARGPLPVDLVFNICEGRDGRSREAQVPALLEMLGVPYTGSDPLTLAVSLDKGVTKRLLRDKGVPTPDFAVLADPLGAEGLSLRYPLFVKPIHEGTGKGIARDSLARDPAELRRKVAAVVSAYAQPALVEEFLPGREFTVGVLGTDPAETIGTMEIIVHDRSENGIYSSTSKAEWERKVRYQYNDAIEPALRREVEAAGLAAYLALECRDFGRIDIRCDAAGRPHVMEVNPLAGLSPAHSDLCFIARESGISHPEVVGRIIASAARRTGLGERL